MVVEYLYADGCALGAYLHLLHLLTHERHIAVRSEDHIRLDAERGTWGKREVGDSNQIATCHRNCLSPMGRCPPYRPIGGQDTSIVTDSTWD